MPVGKKICHAKISFLLEFNQKEKYKTYEYHSTEKFIPDKLGYMKKDFLK